MAGLAVDALFSGRLAERLRRPLLTCAWIECGRQHGGGPATPTSLESQNVEFRGALARLRGGTLSR
jgi:hypothetical protein